MLFLRPDGRIIYNKKPQKGGASLCVNGRKLKLPIGIENFEDIRREGFYYVDKTVMIRDLLQNWGKVIFSPAPGVSEISEHEYASDLSGNRL